MKCAPAGHRPGRIVAIGIDLDHAVAAVEVPPHLRAHGAWLGCQWHAGIQARTEVATLRAELNAAHDALTDAEADRQRAADRHAWELEAVEAALTKERQAAEAAAALIATIDATAPARDGAVAPVLLDTLRGL